MDKIKVNTRFGKLVVLRRLEDKKYPSGQKIQMYECVCDCGIIKQASEPTLRYEHTKSCGCLQKETAKLNAKIRKGNHNRSPIGQANIRALYAQYKARSKRNGTTFTLSKEEFEKYIFNVCYYCGVPPQNLMKSYDPTLSEEWVKLNTFLYNGIDRKDNNMGYSIENCVTCCKHCNVAKGTMTTEQFDNWLITLYNFRFKSKSVDNQL